MHLCTSRRSLAALILAGMLPLHAMDIIAHRGASFDAPENSISAMKLAWQQGADGIETDIHFSRDGHIVVIHDSDTKRVAGVQHRIAACTWEQLKGLDIGRRKHARWTGETIPTLDAVLATIPEGKSIFIEIKVDTRILPMLEKTLAASGKSPAQIRILTFDLASARKAKKRFAQYQVYWLVGYGDDEATGQPPEVDELIKLAKSAKLDGLDLDSRFPINSAFVQKIHAAGLQAHVWTVDDPRLAAELGAAGVDSITTNRPDLLRSRMREREGKN